MADSITQGTLASWEKSSGGAALGLNPSAYYLHALCVEVGEFVKQDETVANIETDKVTIPVNSPVAGLLTDCFAKLGDTVQVGSDLFKLDPDKKPKESPAKEGRAAKESRLEETEPKAAPHPRSGEAALFVETAPVTSKAPPASSASEARGSPSAGSPPQSPDFSAATGFPTTVTSTAAAAASPSPHREPMSRMRMRIAERMKEAQNTAASLTTFNEVDMSALVSMRARCKDDFFKKHGVKLGFMSPFIRASAICLQEMPIVNAHIEGTDVVYNRSADISVAVATPKGLVTPVLRGCERLSLASTERALHELGERARQGRIALEELAGGTFTISNGGVFGSMMGTPILNVPQSAILGMHAIRDRPVVVEGQIQIRPMMYVALTYDHRLIDGREAVTFLVRLKALLEDPTRMLLDI